MVHIGKVTSHPKYNAEMIQIWKYSVEIIQPGKASGHPKYSVEVISGIWDVGIGVDIELCRRIDFFTVFMQNLQCIFSSTSMKRFCAFLLIKFF